jgi:polyvinyl alcohol dehydrogenase (cytochrome)
LIAALAVGSAVASAPALCDWPFAGQNAQNTRSADGEKKLGVANVGNLKQKWVYETKGDVSATATVLGDAVYVVDHGNFNDPGVVGGWIHRIDRQTGQVVWKKNVNDLIPAPPFSAQNKSRTSLAVAAGSNNSDKTKFNDGLIFGTQTGAVVASISKTDGHLLWKTTLQADPFAMVTQSPMVVGDRVYVGVASAEENFAAFIPGYVCCHSRGSVAALDVNTGQVIWQTYTIPASRVMEGYSGAGVWGSTVAVDAKRKSLYVTTGNNYSAPLSARECVRDAGEDIAAVRGCTPSDVLFDAVIALDMDTGAIKWARRFWSYDAWNVGCIPGIGANELVCPDVATGPDYDFAQGASLFTVSTGPGNSPKKSVDLVGAGQKSGFYWALNPDNGDVVWSREVGPGSTLGGLEWGSAVDGTRVYVALVNLEHRGYFLEPNHTPASAGGWAAIDAATGKPVWQLEDPGMSMGLGPVAVANGVVYACSMHPDGHMYAFNAADGHQLWSFASGASCNNGPAIVDGVVYWGTGYGVLGPGLGKGGNKVYAFALD